jgi:hypothetical protein
MSPKHYRCHVIYVRKTKSERVSDTVHFKHKYITQPTLTPEDTIAKALNNVTCALKDWRNKKGTEEIEALQKIGELLNNIPVKATAVQPTIQMKRNTRVTFDETS